MIFHGKKTVPATVRRDFWTPYFSIHFPPTPAGALEGLFAFQKLRELSTQRQLSGPPALIYASQEDIDRAKYKIGSPLNLSEVAEQGKLKDQLPKLDDLLSKKDRARKLMDQKATSVADAAFVLEWITSGLTPLERLTRVQTQRLLKHTERSQPARKRINEIRREEQKQNELVRRRAQVVLSPADPTDRTRIQPSFDALHALSLEHQSPAAGGRIEEIDGAASLRKATQEWLSFNDLTPATIDAERFTTRERVARAAEREAIHEWFETNTVPSHESDSVWTLVQEKKRVALQKFDQSIREAEEQAEAEERAQDDAFAKLQAQALAEGRPVPTKRPGKGRKRPVSNDQSEDGAEAGAEGHEKVEPSWATTREIKMYWADPNDGLFAARWPEGVYHGELQPFAVANTQMRRRSAFTSEDISFHARSTDVHTMAMGMDQGPAPGEGTRRSMGSPLSTTAPPNMKMGRRRSVRPARDTTAGPSMDETPSAGLWARVRGFLGR